MILFYQKHVTRKIFQLVVKKDVTLFIDRSKPSGFLPLSSPPAAKKENYFFPRFHIADMRDEIANSREISQKTGARGAHARTARLLYNPYAVDALQSWEGKFEGATDRDRGL